VDVTGIPSEGDWPEAWSSRAGVHPDDITAPQPVITGTHHHEVGAHPHEGLAGPEVSPPGHHLTPRPGPPRRRRGVLAVAAVAAGVLVVGTVGAFALSHASGDPVAQASSPPSTSDGAPSGVGVTPDAAAPADATSTDVEPPLAPSQSTLVLGDSLGLVVYPWLADLLPDRYVTYQSEVGRSTPATLKKLKAAGSVPPVVIVSSGTNDSSATVLEESARSILDELGTGRCVVWVDVVRPDRIGDSQTAMNAALDRAVQGRANVRILHWTKLVAAHPEWMSGDGIHPNEVGSEERAKAFAEAARSCSALDPAAPRAKRQYLPQSIFWGPVSGQYRRPSATKSSSSSRTPTTSATSSPTKTSTPTATPTPTPTPTPTKTTSAPPPDPTTPPASSTTPASDPTAAAAQPSA
jgi:hypothetical protein